MSHNLTNANKPAKSKGKRVQVLEPINDDFIKVILPSILGGLFLAFGKTFWVQSTSVEVYPLQLFLFNLIKLYMVLAV